MQVVKNYSGTINAGTSSAREYTYGQTSTTSIFTNVSDFICETIANFLHDDCGVEEAVYEAREGSNYKFLWIFNIPFLFYPVSGGSGSSAYRCTNFYSPFSMGYCNGKSGYSSTSYASTLLSAALTANTDVDYGFGLYFDGNPKSAFSLRFSIYGASTPSAYFHFNFVKCKNVLSGKDSIIWTFVTNNNGSSSSAWSASTRTIALDLNENGTIDTDSGETGLEEKHTVTVCSTGMKTKNPGKFPLIPVTFGSIYISNDLYLVPYNFGIPSTESVTKAIIPTVTIANKEFIVSSMVSSTQSSNASNEKSYNYIGLGLIDTTSS